MSVPRRVRITHPLSRNLRAQKRGLLQDVFVLGKKNIKKERGRGDKGDSLCFSQKCFVLRIKGPPCYSEDGGRCKSIFKRDLWCDIFVSCLISLQTIKKILFLFIKNKWKNPLLLYPTLFLKHFPVFLKIISFRLCSLLEKKNRTSVWTRLVDMRGFFGGRRGGGLHSFENSTFLGCCC